MIAEFIVSTLVTIGFVSCIYVWHRWSYIHKDDPRVVTRRFLTLIPFTLFAPFLTYVILPSQWQFTLLSLYGISGSIFTSVKACFAGVLIILTLFSGHIYSEVTVISRTSQVDFLGALKIYCTLDWKEFFFGDIQTAIPVISQSFIDEFPFTEPYLTKYSYSSGAPSASSASPSASVSSSASASASTKSNVPYKPAVIHENRFSNSLINWRNLIIAPITEEICFRGAVSTLLFRASSTSASTMAFLGSPLLFSLAHAHHVYNLVRSRGIAPISAVVSVAIQLSYTFVFGLIVSYIYLRTGDVSSAIVAHIICNTFGLPSTALLGASETDNYENKSHRSSHERQENVEGVDKQTHKRQKYVALGLYLFGFFGFYWYAPFFISILRFDDTSMWRA